MSVLNICTDTPIIYYDESLRMHIKLSAAWEVESGTEQEYEKSTIKFFVLNTLTDILREYQRTVPFEELSGKYDEISSVVSDKLTEKMGFPCSARLTELKPDEDSAEILRLHAEKKRLSDPAVMAAELEKAMQKARETSERTGIPIPENPYRSDRAPSYNAASDPFTSSCVPPFNGNKELMEKITGGMLSDDRSYKPNEPRNIGLMGMTPPDNNMSAYRPKFCMHCGSKLPPTGNFCGNCGKSIM